ARLSPQILYNSSWGGAPQAHPLNGYNLSVPFQEYIAQKLSLEDFNLLNINLDHLNAIVTMPFHHKDPFDRLLIAQAMVEGIPILSKDSAFDAYPINRIW
ncbi:type II toxin-antitoxin system VapC family toxin, partial [Microcoleus sp. D3_18_C4]|uniref:type II toxin-antitoxin system VapC family toxin n=1 Tax=Microcoleus sp. D3_18_C4 TaxID=3055335 RepID=UPI002FD3A091